MPAPKWTIATARQHLPKLIGMAAREPQRVYRRDKLVAAVVSPDLAQALQSRRGPSLASKLAELQRLCADENYELSTPVRRDRVNRFVSRQTSAKPRTRRSPGR